jgi:hypothetical protein
MQDEKKSFLNMGILINSLMQVNVNLYKYNRDYESEFRIGLDEKNSLMEHRNIL